MRNSDAEALRLKDGGLNRNAENQTIEAQEGKRGADALRKPVITFAISSHIDA